MYGKLEERVCPLALADCNAYREHAIQELESAIEEIQSALVNQSIIN